MSINDHPEVRELFERFRIEEEPVNYRVGTAVKPVVELVISGGEEDVDSRPRASI